MPAKKSGEKKKEESKEQPKVKETLVAPAKEEKPVAVSKPQPTLEIPPVSTPKEEPKVEVPQPAAKAEKKEEAPKPAAKVAGKKVAVEDLLATIEQMTILELNDLVKKMEDRFGITAAAPVAVAAVPAAQGAAQAAPVEEKTSFTVMLTDSGASKINVIKIVRKYNQTLGLKEAKDLVEAPPKPVVENVKKEEAETIKKELEEAGAKVELK